MCKTVPRDPTPTVHSATHFSQCHSANSATSLLAVVFGPGLHILALSEVCFEEAGQVCWITSAFVRAPVTATDGGAPH